MYDEDRFTKIVNTDISSVCIAQMAHRNAQLRQELEWVVMDCRKMDLPSDAFDLIIDKSTLDALLCGKNSFLNVARMLREC